MAAVHVVRFPSASKDEQRCGGMALPAECQGEPRPAESLPADSAAARRVSAMRMLSECGTTRLQNAYSRLHSRLHLLWNEYCAGSRDVAQLLNACARDTKCI